MPKTPVDEAPAGPEMDAAVAKVLGLNEFNDWPERWEHIISHNWNEMSYSTDIAAAWGLWQQLAKRFRWAEVMIIEASQSAMTLYHPTDSEFIRPVEAFGETVPLAICRAFLKANGVEYIEVPE